MKDKKIFTIIGVICILLAIGVIVFALANDKHLNFIMVLPLFCAVGCLIIARMSK